MPEFHYGDYLRSERWAELRATAVGEADGRCQVCNSSDDLNVHHRTYERLGQDDEWRDLVVLCRICHEGYHFLIAEGRPKQRQTIYALNDDEQVFVGYREDGSLLTVAARDYLVPGAVPMK